MKLLIATGYVVVFVGYTYLIIMGRRYRYDNTKTYSTDEMIHNIKGLEHLTKFNEHWFRTVLFYVITTTVLIQFI